MAKSVTIKVPGKLMVAGEYAVLEPEQQLIVTAVDRFVYASIQSSGENLLTLENFGLTNMSWQYINQDVSLDITDDRTSFVRTSMGVVLTYLVEQSIPVHPFTLSITSELDDDSGIKYGLGSSAAVVTSVVAAILTKFLRKEPSPEVVFKLAAIAHVKTQGSGSGADIAASTYGGMLQYSSFQADWLLQKIYRTESITQLVAEKWIYLSVNKMNFPLDWQMCVGWTGTPASTANLVAKILDLKDHQPEQFQQFIANSSQAVEIILQGINLTDINLFFYGITQNRYSLALIGQQAQVDVETPLLKILSDKAEHYGGAGKMSGAGGGDCGIAFVKSNEQVKQLKNDWELAGIKPLAMQFYSHGAHQIE